MRALAADDRGRIVADSREPTEPAVVEQIARIARDLGSGSLAAVGVGVPGTVDPATGRVSQIPNVRGLDGLELPRALEQMLGVPVVVENDLAAAATAELAAFPTAQTIAVIAAGTGIGLGLAHNGELIRGATGAAGEIAYLPLESGGILEDVVSTAGLRRAYQERSGVSADVDAILERAERGDHMAVDAVVTYSRGLAHGIRVVLAILDPEVLVLTGGLSGAQPVAAAVREQLGAVASRLTFSGHGVDSPAHGALALALRHVAPFPASTDEKPVPA